MRYTNQTSSRAVFLRGFQPDILERAMQQRAEPGPGSAAVPAALTAASQKEPPAKHTGLAALKGAQIYTEIFS